MRSREETCFRCPETFEIGLKGPSPTLARHRLLIIPLTSCLAKERSSLSRDDRNIIYQYYFSILQPSSGGGGGVGVDKERLCLTGNYSFTWRKNTRHPSVCSRRSQTINPHHDESSWWLCYGGSRVVVQLWVQVYEVS